LIITHANPRKNLPVPVEPSDALQTDGYCVVRDR
jgi:hypothetical protein